MVFTGGSGSLIAESKEALAARELLIKLDVDPARIIVEDQSRNTEENARFTAAIVRPRTHAAVAAGHLSAFRICPVRLGYSRKPDLDVESQDPVAYRTLGPGNGWQWDLDSGKRIRIFEAAVHEWIRPRHIPGNRKDR